MANWSNPQLTSTYTNFLAEVKARDVDLALQFSSGSPTNMPTGSIQWNSTENRWKKWSGSSWGELTSTYQLTALTTEGTASFGGNVTITGTKTLDVGGSTTASSFIVDGTTAPSSQGIYAPSSNTLGFSAGGHQANLTTTGLKLGSGTASCKLDVVGGIKVSGGITNGSHGYGFSSNDTDGGMYSNANDELTFKTNDTRRLTIQGDQIGVNITNPDVHLHVCNTNTNNSAAGTGFRISNSEGSYSIWANDDRAYHYADTFLFNNESGSQTYGTWNSTGLGVNCWASTGNRFEVDGNAKVVGNLRVGALLFNSNGSAYKPADLNINATNKLLYQVSGDGGTAGNTAALSSSGSSGQFLKSNGSSSAPSWSTISTAGVTPIGGIIIWYGAVNTIPTGWSLCNGSQVNGHTTPDLRARFVVGSGVGNGAKNPGQTGGSEDAVIVAHAHGSSNKTSTDGSHGHSISNDSHQHSYTSPTVGTYAGLKTDTHGSAVEYPTNNGASTTASATGITINANGNHDHTISSTGVSGTDKNMPPYYALCYIMRTS